MKLRHPLTLTIALASLLLRLHARAATIYSNLQDIAIPTNFAGVYLDIDAGDTSGSSFAGWDINPFFGGAGIGNSAAFQPVRVGAGNLDAVLNLAPGTVVSSSLTFATGPGGSGNPGHQHIGPGAGQFQVGVQGYLGFKFTMNDTTGPLLNGWMRLTLTNNVPGALIRDWGYDDVGETIAVGRVEQSAPDANTQLVTLSPEAGESFTLGSAISDTGGNTNNVLKTGAGSVKLGTANTFTGGTTVSGGTLEAGGVDALGGTSGVTINTGGTLLLSGSGDRLNDAAGITLAGGMLSTGGLSETVGTLTLTGDSVIDMGAGASVLRFADSSAPAIAALWTGTLSIWNWSGNQNTGNGIDQLYFGNGSGIGLEASQLLQIKFYSDAGSTILPYAPGFSAFTGGFGEVVPVPVPGSVATALGLLGLIGWRERRRRW